MSLDETGVVPMVLKKKSPAASIAKKASKKVAHKVATSKALRKRDVPAKTGDATTPAKKGLVKETAGSPKRTSSKTSTTKTGAKRKPSAPSMSIDFAPGTDMEAAFHEVLLGGASRSEVSHRLAAIWADTKTRNGNAKPVSTILNHVIRRAKANGYEIQQTWKLVKTDSATASDGDPDESAAKSSGVSFKEEAEQKKKAPRKLPVKPAVKAVKRRKPA